MAKKTADATTPTKKAKLQVSVKFSGVSIGKNTARVGAKILRDILTIDQAEGFFCNRRLVGSIRLGSRSEDPAQTKFLDTDLVVTGSFDVKGYNAQTDSFNIGLTFALTEIDIADLAKFAGGSGQLTVQSTAEIPVDE